MRWLSLLCFATLASAGDWTRFRGPNGEGVSDATGLPVEFGPKKNLFWRIEVPMGRSSPIVVKDRVYVTALDGEKLVTLCLRQSNGSEIWRREIVRDHTNKIFAGNNTATPTPASDGENIYVFFADLGLLSYDAAGNERWRLNLGPFDSFYGISSSPVVHGNTVAVVCDQRKGSFVLAAGKDTGRVLWRKERKQATTEGYSTPAIHSPAGKKPQLVVTGAYRLEGYDLETGEVVWWIGKQGVYPIGSPVFSGDLVFAVGMGSDKPEYPPYDGILQQLDGNKDGKLSREECAKDEMMRDHFGWVDTNEDGVITREEWEQKVRESVTEHGVTGSRIRGTGDRTEADLIWRYKKSYSNTITPLIYRDVLYLIKDGGIITSLNPKTGGVFKTDRTKDAIDEYFASPVGADGKIYLVSHSGKVTVMSADPEWKILAVNDLGETSQATPAIANGRIYIRTHKALYSFGSR